MWKPITFYQLAEKLCLPILMDLTMDMYRAHHLYHNRYISKGRIASVCNTGPESTLRRYAIDTWLYRFLNDSSSETTEKRTTSDFLGIIKHSYDVGLEILTLVRRHAVKILLMDPREANNCDYHCHKKGEEWLVKAAKKRS